MSTRFGVCFFAAILLSQGPDALAKLFVVTTTPDLAAVVEELGKDEISVESIARGTQDPHYIEAKPSYMVKVSRADLVVSVGLELEVGWLPSILQGARNPKVKAGAKGNLEVGPLVDLLEIHTGTVTRADGDVHPFGNPHLMLDPARAGAVGIKIAQRLGELDGANAKKYEERAQALQKRLGEKTKTWQVRIAKSGIKKVVTYHKALTYFFDRFKLENSAILEPKPGIPPTSKHVLTVIELMKQQKITLVLIENFFDPSPVRRIADEVKGVRLESVPVGVGGEPQVKTLDDLYERLVVAVEGQKP